MTVAKAAKTNSSGTVARSDVPVAPTETGSAFIQSSTELDVGLRLGEFEDDVPFPGADCVGEFEKEGSEELYSVIANVGDSDGENEASDCQDLSMLRAEEGMNVVVGEAEGCGVVESDCVGAMDAAADHEGDAEGGEEAAPITGTLVPKSAKVLDNVGEATRS